MDWGITTHMWRACVSVVERFVPDLNYWKFAGDADLAALRRLPLTSSSNNSSPEPKAGTLL